MNRVLFSQIVQDGYALCNWNTGSMRCKDLQDERSGEVGGSKPTAAVLCPWARHFTPRKYWLITQERVAPSRHDWKIVDWDVKPQHKQVTYIWWSSDFVLLSWRLFDGLMLYWRYWFNVTQTLNWNYIICRPVTYIPWSSDFVLYLEDYLTDNCHNWNIGSMWCKD